MVQRVRVIVQVVLVGRWRRLVCLLLLTSVGNRDRSERAATVAGHWPGVEEKRLEWVMMMVMMMMVSTGSIRVMLGVGTGVHGTTFGFPVLAGFEASGTGESKGVHYTRGPDGRHRHHTEGCGR